ncbi:MAG: hypothetical protein ABSD89_07430 [Halobacteriota archaeon]|jgi:hypothetical protein
MSTSPKWLLLLLVFLLSAFFGKEAQAKTVNAASCSQADVASAVAQAANGDTVMIPSCSQTNWTTTVQVNTCIDIEGQGQGVTTLGDNVAKNGTDTSVLFLFNGNCSSGNIQLANMTIVGVATDPSIYNKGHVRILGTPQYFRVHHITMNNPTTSFLTANTPAYGLVDHLTVPNCNPSGGSGAINLKASAWGGGNNSYGDASWADTASLPGSSSAIFIEDSTFSCTDPVYLTNVMDGDSGARFVFRFNTLTGANTTSHGTDSSQRERSIRWQEVYKNAYNFSSQASPGFIAWVRGGSGIMWGNSVTGQGWLSSMLQVSNLRDSTSYTPWGQCNGTSVYDRNSNSTGYICVDQPGAGTSNLLSGDPPAPTSWVGNISFPIYVYLNSASGSENDTTGNSTNVQQNRDYFLYTSSFNGTSGVGSGPIASRPAACTTGVGYWATDQGSWNTKLPANTSGQLYKCTSTNTWTLYYTPYTYPHPLSQGSSATLPSAPTNVQAAVVVQ